MAERYGDFELLRLIATGGMAEIYLAQQGSFGGFSRNVVVKRMLPQLAVRPDFVQMFLDEARLAANLNHPNIVQVFNLGEVDQSYFIAMEFVDGPHLGSLFAHSLRLRKPLPVELCAYIVARAADGLHYAHEQMDPATGEPLHLVHRDISPQNILVSRQGDVKVTDFGVAKATTQQTKTRTGIIKGKVAYMSPEQCLGEVVDRRTDIFALGIVLYELLTRRRLFRDKSDLLIMQKITGEDVPPPSTVNKDLDAELDAICMKALARDRDARFATAAELSEALDSWLSANATGDARIQLQKWFENNALELSIGAQEEMGTSPSHVTAQVRPAPQEATAATPSLNSTETVMRPHENSSSGTVRPRLESQLRDRSTPALLDEPTQLQRPSSTEGVAAPARSNPGVLAIGVAAPESRDAPVDATMALRPSPPRAAEPDLDEPARPRRPVAAIVVGGVLGVVVLGLVVVLATREGKKADAPPPPAADVDAGARAPVDANRARIVIESVPAGVSILLDDERVVGKTPLTVEHAPGRVKLQAQFADQPPLNEEIEAGPGAERVVRLLAKVPLVVKSTPEKAKVRVDGELLGETPLEKTGLLAPERPVKVRVEAPGYIAFEKELTPEAGAPLVLDLPLEKVGAPPRTTTPKADKEPKFGLLNMRSTPWVDVRIGPLNLGATILAQVKVPAGKQVLSLTNPEQGIKDTLVVTIPEDKPLSVTLEWEKKGNEWKIKTRSIK
jgi:serine/threonine protein kinase